jgi:putative transcriptional regulator
MADDRYLANSFLVAMPGLEDDNFDHSVTLVCEHNDNGALGLIINRLTDLKLKDMLSHMGIEPGQLDGQDIRVFWGGPVQPERGFVVHREPGEWESTLQVADDLYITTSRDILDALSEGRGPGQFFVALGYAGWEAGQLEHEILGNTWLNAPVDRAILFEMPAGDRWDAAARLIGVDVSRLSGQAGHA